MEYRIKDSNLTRNEIKTIKREEAEERQKIYNAKKPEEILAELDRIGLVAEKERAKLNRRINGSN